MNFIKSFIIPSLIFILNLRSNRADPTEETDREKKAERGKLAKLSVLGRARAVMRGYSAGIRLQTRISYNRIKISLSKALSILKRSG